MSIFGKLLFFLLVLLALSYEAQCGVVTTDTLESTTEDDDNDDNSDEEDWREDTLIYHIWPRSFQDSDGDGVGDLQGKNQYF